MCNKFFKIKLRFVKKYFNKILSLKVTGNIDEHLKSFIVSEILEQIDLHYVREFRYIAHADKDEISVLR